MQDQDQPSTQPQFQAVRRQMQKRKSLLPSGPEPGEFMSWLATKDPASLKRTVAELHEMYLDICRMAGWAPVDLERFRSIARNVPSPSRNVPSGDRNVPCDRVERSVVAKPTVPSIVPSIVPASSSPDVRGTVASMSDLDRSAVASSTVPRMVDQAFENSRNGYQKAVTIAALERLGTIGDGARGWRIIETLRAHGGSASSQEDLVGMIDGSKAHVSRTLDLLERRGVVERERIGRRNKVTLVELAVDELPAASGGVV